MTLINSRHPYPSKYIMLFFNGRHGLWERGEGVVLEFLTINFNTSFQFLIHKIVIAIILSTVSRSYEKKSLSVCFKTKGQNNIHCHNQSIRKGVFEIRSVRLDLYRNRSKIHSSDWELETVKIGQRFSGVRNPNLSLVSQSFETGF